VTVVRNGDKYLQATIDSIASQSYRNIEYIVIDGQSKDGTIQIIEANEAKIDYWVSEPDGGIYAAMNKGIALCRGSLIGLKNADDMYTPGAVEQAVKTAQGNGAAIVYGDTFMIWNEAPLQTSIFKSDHRLVGGAGGVDHRTMFVQAAVYRQLNYEARYRIGADYAFLLEAKKRGLKFAHTGTVLAYKRGGGASASFQTLSEIFAINKQYLGMPHAIAVWLRSLRNFAFYGLGNQLL
jgi:glycosyltransferase involved in cell wall biosynthesis